MVLTAVEQRLVDRTLQTNNDTVISVYNDFSAFFGSIPRILPDTQTKRSFSKTGCIRLVRGPVI
jgi:hypothetical protein